MTIKRKLLVKLLLAKLVDSLVIALDMLLLRLGGLNEMTEKWSAIKESFLRAVLIRNPIHASKVADALLRKGVKAAIRLEKQLVAARAEAQRNLDLERKAKDEEETG